MQLSQQEYNPTFMVENIYNKCVGEENTRNAEHSKQTAAFFIWNLFGCDASE